LPNSVREFEPSLKKYDLGLPMYLQKTAIIFNWPVFFKNHIRKVSIFILLSYFFGNTVFAGTYSGGTGAEEAPYQIDSFSDLQELSSTPSDWGAYFVQTSNIDASESINIIGGFSPIGDYVTGNRQHQLFRGVYDGQHHKITGLYISRQEVGSGITVGLFGAAYSATIKNLALIDVEISGGMNVGGLVGWMYSGLIENCYVTGIINGIDSRVGGIAGQVNMLFDDLEVQIINSISTANVSGVDMVGGLVGYNSNGVVTDSYSTGAVIGDGYGVGGLVGWLSGEKSKVNKCHATGSVTGSTSAGGLIGRIIGESSPKIYVTNSYSEGSVVSGSYTGGLIGNSSEAIIDNCYATGDIVINAQHSSYVGGLIGSISNTSVNNCFSSGSVIATSGSTGGFIGVAYNSTISSCYSLGVKVPHKSGKISVFRVTFSSKFQVDNCSTQSIISWR
jgi:hypothetical protein